MPEIGSAPLKNTKHELYCVGRASGLNKKDAHLNAGYAGSAHGGPPMVEQCSGVLDRLAFLQKLAAEQMIRAGAVSTAITRNQLNIEAQETYRRAMEGTPVMAKDGSETGVSKPDLAAANRSIEIRAKLNGLMIDVSANVEDLDAELEGKGPEELRGYVLSLLAQLDPNLSKTVKAQLEAADASEDSKPEPKQLLQ